MRRQRNQPKFINPYKSEHELCDVLIQHAKENGWSVYPETSGFDILLVKDIQIGVQAKLKDNLEVLAQSVEYCSFYNKHSDFVFTTPEPDLHAVLVPRSSKDFQKVARALGIYVIHGAIPKWDFTTGKCEWIKAIEPYTSLDKYNKKYLTNSKKKCWVPEIQISVPAGVKSPKLVTEWKIKAIRLCIKLKQNGYLTSKDFKDEKVNMTLWVNKWIINSGEKIGKLVKYIKAPNAKLPDELYPEITNAILQNLNK